MLNNKLLNIAFLSTSPPRQCGLATFTQDLIDAKRVVDTNVIAVNKSKHRDYSNKVIYEINQNNQNDYIELAHKLNHSNIDLLVIEHEYGIYGGDYGVKFKMNVIDKFLERYLREYDYYLESAKLCAQQCENGLERNGIRAVVTFRVKKIDRLKDKLEKRNEIKEYKRVEDIYKDIVDLAGVRIALYFPGDSDEVDKLIRSNFNVLHTKIFPQKKKSSYQKLFPGYSANHYTLNLKNELLSETSKRYAQAQIEIQVASVLIYAWAEVEHDLVYKPSSGDLSVEEYEILDELNGLVLAGEVALERLQKAVNLRIGEKGKKFNNHYERSSYLYDSIRNIMNHNENEPIIKKTNIIYNFLH